MGKKHLILKKCLLRTEKLIFKILMQNVCAIIIIDTIEETEK